ncbi:MAG: TonB-dependent receptor plug domain-containing protein [Mariniphaga sp.]
MKRKYMMITFFLFLSLMTSLVAKAQDIEGWMEANEKVPVEKLYLHTDREYYFSDETIHLKAYLTDSRSGRLIPGAENIYIHLIDGSGRLVLEHNLMAIHGQVPGQIDLPDTLRAGGYMLQAFTDYLLNFGEEAFFYKKLWISKTARPARAVESRQRNPSNRRMVADVTFLPEGGAILEGVPNVVAFKAVDRNGYGADVRGSVRDESGREVVTFSTDYKGMGMFFMTPQPGKSYHATIFGFPSFRFSFDSLIVQEGVKIQLVNQTSRELIVNILSNFDQYEDDLFYLVNMHRGESVFYQPFHISGKSHLLKFDSQMLKGGVNRLVLLDKNLAPVSERLLFSNTYDVHEVDIRVSGSSVSTRSEISLNLSGGQQHSDPSNLSLAVVHEAAFGGENPSQDILSYLLIDSELNGFIENPTDFFIDSGISALSKQRLLMLTHGWKGYFWNGVPGIADTLNYRQNVGLTLRGMATDKISGQPLHHGEITLVIEKDQEMAFLTQTTDEKGIFSFPGLLFNDTAKVYVQAKNEMGRQNTNITLLPAFHAPVSISALKSLGGTNEIPPALEILKYNEDQVLLAYNRRMAIGQKMDEPTESPDLSEGDGHFRIYNLADQVIEITEADVSFSNVIDYLVGKVAGLDISGDQVTIRGTSNFNFQSTPLFLIDGIPVSDDLRAGGFIDQEEEMRMDNRNASSKAIDKIKSIPLQDIDKVEILKSPQNLTLFGMEGANGVIAIYTHRGKSENPSAVVKGVIEEKIKGYASFQKFYAPRYSPENISDVSPDYRTTLFWEPEILLNESGVDMTFFSSDQTGKYIIIVEGINDTGGICIGTTDFEVKGNVVD